MKEWSNTCLVSEAVGVVDAGEDVSHLLAGHTGQCLPIDAPMSEDTTRSSSDNLHNKTLLVSNTTHEILNYYL